MAFTARKKLMVIVGTAVVVAVAGVPSSGWWTGSSIGPSLIAASFAALLMLALCWRRDLFRERARIQSIEDEVEQSVAARTGKLVHANQELVVAAKAAYQASLAKSDFLAAMSHEIRTPMTGVIGYLDVLDSAGDASGQTATEARAAIRRNAEHLLSVITDILDLSRIEAGQLKPEPVECSLFEITDDVEALLRPTAESKGLILEVIPQFPLPEKVRVDAYRLRQVLMNVVGNGIKFTQEGTVSLQFGLEETDDGVLLRFDVIDSGLGMSTKQQERLFKPFTQGDGSMARRHGGVGVGLAIASRLARLLGGSIRVESAEGEGSQFTILIDPGVPASSALCTTRPAKAQDSEAACTADLGSLSGKVLVAEDGLDNQRIIRFLLSKAGIEPTVVENGQLAVDAVVQAEADGDPFVLLLSDMQMPVLDGYAAARELRQRGFDLPIVALTAHAMAEDRDRCLAAGCTDYLTKPIVPKKLLATVATHLGQSVTS